MTQNAINNSASSMDIDNINIDGNTISSTDTNGDVVLAPDGDGTVSVTAAPIVPSTDRADSLGSATNSWDNVYCDGVSFDDGTNTLATYLTGSWTPTISFGGGSTGVAYSSQTGLYTQIGNVVYYYVNLTLSSKGSSSGVAAIGGLPITIGSTTNFNPAAGWRNITFTADYYVMSLRAPASGSTLEVYEVGSGAAGTVQQLDDGNFSNDTFILASGFYFT